MSQAPLFPAAAPVFDRELGQWHTPPKLAKRIVERFLCAGDFVLEPTAGGGALVGPALEAGCYVRAMDIDERWTAAMRDRFGAEIRSGVLSVDRENYLEAPIAGRPIVLMNPPDASKQGLDVVDFMSKALDDAGPMGSVVALVRLNALTGAARHSRVWSRARLTAVCHLVSRPSFGPSGGMQEWVVVRYGLPAHGVHTAEYVSRPLVEWWSEAWS